MAVQTGSMYCPTCKKQVAADVPRANHILHCLLTLFMCGLWLVLTGQPVSISTDWSEPTVQARLDADQWTCLGSRHDRTASYGRTPLETVLADVNVDILVVFFPLEIVPMGPLDGDPHRLRPEVDYPVWRNRLPEGYITLDEVKIRFA